MFVYDPDVVEPGVFLASIQQMEASLFVRTEETSPLFGPLSATMEGYIREGHVHLTKVYDQSCFCNVIYDGNVSSDGKNIQGDWHLASRGVFDNPASGTFEMQRRPAERGEETINAKKETPVPAGPIPR